MICNSFSILTIADDHSITKTMGTTFMLHSEALSGDLDVNGDDSERSSVSTPSMSSRITSGLDLQTAVY